MSRLTAIDPTTAKGKTAELLQATVKQLGKAPNLYRTMAHSPAALDGYLRFRGARVGGVLTPQLREQIALLVAAFNDCAYCVSAHVFRGGKVGLSSDELSDTQRGQAMDPKVHAALRFVSVLLEQRGRIADADFAAVTALGWTNEEIGEMVAHVALNVFSNYFNHVALPELDFPPVAGQR